MPPTPTPGAGVALALTLAAGMLVQHGATAFLSSRGLSGPERSAVSALMAVFPGIPAAVAIAKGGLSTPRAPLRSHVFLALLLGLSWGLTARAPFLLPPSLVLVIKSCRLLPTLIIGSLWLRRQYSATDWAAAAVSAAGLSLVLAGPAVHGPPGGPGAPAHGAATTVHGAAMLLGILVLDGLAVIAQEGIFQQYGVSRGELLSRSYGGAAVIASAYGMREALASEAVRSATGPLRVALSLPGVALALSTHVLASFACTSSFLSLVRAWGGSSAMFVTTVVKAVIVGVGFLAAGTPVAAVQGMGVALVLASVALTALGTHAEHAKEEGGQEGTSLPPPASPEKLEAGSGVPSPVASSPPPRRGEPEVGAGTESSDRSSQGAGSPLASSPVRASPLAGLSTPDLARARGLLRDGLHHGDEGGLLPLLRTRSSRALSTLSISLVGLDRAALSPQASGLSPIRVRK